MPTTLSSVLITILVVVRDVQAKLQRQTSSKSVEMDITLWLFWIMELQEHMETMREEQWPMGQEEEQLPQ